MQNAVLIFIAPGAPYNNALAGLKGDIARNCPFLRLIGIVGKIQPGKGAGLGLVHKLRKGGKFAVVILYRTVVVVHILA